MRTRTSEALKTGNEGQAAGLSTLRLINARSRTKDIAARALMKGDCRFVRAMQK